MIFHIENWLRKSYFGTFDSFFWPFNKSEKMCLRNLLMYPYDPLSMAPKLAIDARPPEDQSGHSVRIY